MQAAGASGTVGHALTVHNVHRKESTLLEANVMWFKRHSSIVEVFVKDHKHALFACLLACLFVCLRVRLPVCLFVCFVMCESGQVFEQDAWLI